MIFISVIVSWLDSKRKNISFADLLMTLTHTTTAHDTQFFDNNKYVGRVYLE